MMCMKDTIIKHESYSLNNGRKITEAKNKSDQKEKNKMLWSKWEKQQRKILSN